MGFGDWLSSARLAYHGYTPEVVEQMRGLLAQKEQERQWRANEEQRRLQLAEESGKRAADAAQADREADERRREQQRDEAVYEQLKLLPDGIEASRVMGTETMPVAVFEKLRERVRTERTYASEQQIAERERKAGEEEQKRVAGEQRQLALHRQRKLIDREFDTPKTPDDPDKGFDPFFKAALSEIDKLADAGMVPPGLGLTRIDPITKTQTTTLDPAKKDAWALRRAAELKNANRQSRGGPASTPTATPQAPDALSTLTAAERAAYAKMPAADQAKLLIVLSSGNPALVTRARQGLTGARLAR